MTPVPKVTQLIYPAMRREREKFVAADNLARSVPDQEIGARIEDMFERRQKNILTPVEEIALGILKNRLDLLLG